MIDSPETGSSVETAAGAAVGVVSYAGANVAIIGGAVRGPQPPRSTAGQQCEEGSRWPGATSERNVKGIQGFHVQNRFNVPVSRERARETKQNHGPILLFIKANTNAKARLFSYCDTRN